jgi:GT2 family glycosyltransferase
VQPVRASVIIATWNAAGVLGACLDSLLGQRVAGGFETIVVDNASTDATPRLLERYADRVRVIRNDENVRYAGANNQAAPGARGGVLVFLNSDTELLAPDALERLVAAAEEEGVGLAGPLLVNPDGSLQASCAPFPTIPRALLLATGTFRLLPDRLRARLAPDHWSHDRATDTDWVMGAALAVRADVFRELGGFWSTMYAEEEDLAYRARQRGLRVRFEPAARVMHVGNHSLAQRWSDAERAAVIAEADLTFLRTHYARPRAAAIRAITGAGYAARAAVHRALGRPDAARLYRGMAAVYARRRAASTA